MTTPRKAAAGKGEREPSASVLKAKYLDYCSARVAEVLLQLSADEMYLLAQDAAREAGRSEAEPLKYDEMVRLATSRLAARLALPPFEEWVEAYRTDPARFEREMLGLWERELPGPGSGS